MSIDLQRTLRTHFKRLCRPLLRLCVKYSLKFQDLNELLKEAFIEVAQEELARQGETVNVSRLAVVTGLQRKEVARLRQDGPAAGDTGASLLSRIIGQWQQHKDFCRAEGAPRPLNFAGAESEFALLVRSVSKDINPYTVLFELERVGFVERSGESLVLRTGAYRIKGGAQLEQAFELLERDSGDLLTAVTENVLRPPAIPHLHLRTEYDNISPDALSEIQEWLLDKGTTFHEEARAYLAKFDKDVNPRLYTKPGGARVMLGAFSFVQRPEEERHE